MGDFKKNPRQPFGVSVPNKIRKRIAMHEKKDKNRLGPMGSLLMPLVVVARQRGSMWSRFTDRVKKLFG